VAKRVDIFRTALEEIASENKVYKGHGDYDIVPSYSAEQAQRIAQKAITAPYDETDRWIPIGEMSKERREQAGKGRLILGWCVHDADPYFVGERAGPTAGSTTRLTLYGGHCEGIGHVEDGPHILEWGGGWSDSVEDGGGYMPDWWFLSGSGFEAVAFPTHYKEIGDAP